MSINRCPTCGKTIDEDYEVEHYEECRLEHAEDCDVCHGDGEVSNFAINIAVFGAPIPIFKQICEECDGTGKKLE